MNRPGMIREPGPQLLLPAAVEVTAGETVSVPVTVTNTADGPRALVVDSHGADTQWLAPPRHTPVLAPGQSHVVAVELRPAPGTIAARYPLSVSAQALDPVTGTPVSVVTVQPVDLVVGAAGELAMTLTPTEGSAVFGRRYRLTLTNRGGRPELVRLGVRTHGRNRVGVSPDHTVLAPGQSATLRVRGRTRRPSLLGSERRQGFTVLAHSAGAPVRVDGGYTSRPMLGRGPSKVLVVALVLFMWAGAGALAIPKISQIVKDRTTSSSTSTTTSSPSTSPGNGSGGSGSGGSGSGGSGGSGSGSGSGSGGSGGAGSAGSAATLASKRVKINGVVSGAPSGATVTLQPTSLVDEAAQGASPVPNSPAMQTAFDGSGPIGKLAGPGFVTQAPPVVHTASLVTPLRHAVRAAGRVRTAGAHRHAARAVRHHHRGFRGSVSAVRSVVTGTDGTWSFPPVAAPGYYLVTIDEAGFQQQRYVVDAAATQAGDPLTVTLSPGLGSISGTVTGPDGPIADASIRLSDGTTTVTGQSTSAGSPGGAGHWSITGLSQPMSYLVTVAAPGYGTASRLVQLTSSAGTTVDLTLKRGSTTLVGRVVAAGGAPLGGASVSASDGTEVRTATTVTTGSLTGHYVLPDLPPGAYTVTIADAGYQTQTQRIQLQLGGASHHTVNATLEPATATVTGTVGNGTGALAAGLVLSNSTQTYKTVAAADTGIFRFDDVAPGTYSLSASYFGYGTGLRTVTATVGRTTDHQDFTLTPSVTTHKGSIAGFVSSAVGSGGTLNCPGTTCSIGFSLATGDGTDVPIKVNDLATQRVDANATGPTPYTLTAVDPAGLMPGVYTLTVTVSGSTLATPYYLPATVTVRVPDDSVATAPQIALYPTNTIRGDIGAIGSLTTDGYPSGVSATDCVYAIPLADDTNVAPTGCTAPAPSTVCSQTGTPQEGYSDIGDGNTYKIEGLCDGNYAVYVVVNNPAYDAASAPRTVVTLVHGQVYDYSPKIGRLARLLLDVSVLDPATGIITPASGDFAVALTCGTDTYPADPAQPATIAGSRATVWGIQPGQQSCQVIVTPPGGKPSFGSFADVVFADDTDVTQAVTVSPGVDAAYGQVVSSYGSSDAQPIDGTAAAANLQLTVTGTIGYDGITPITATVTVTPNAEGCFALRRKDDTDYTSAAPTSCGSFGPANVATLPITDTKVTVAAAPVDPAVASQLVAATRTVRLNPATATPVTFEPTPAALTLSLQTVPANLPLTGATVTVDATNAHGAGSIIASIGNDGRLGWQDTGLTGVNLVRPGTYVLGVTAPGFVDKYTTTLTCATVSDGGACTLAPLTIDALGTITGTVRAITDATSTSTISTLPTLGGAKVQAVLCSTTPCAPSFDPSIETVYTATTAADGTYTFTGPTPYFLPPGTYALQVVQPGYSGHLPIPADGTRTVSNALITVTVGPGPTTQDVTLWALGSLSGTVSALFPYFSSPVLLSGVTVQAVECSTTCPTTAPAGALSVVTQPNGTYSFTAQAGHPGLDIAQWEIFTTYDGYYATPVVVDVPSGGATSDITMTPLAAVTGQLVPNGTGVFAAGVAGAAVQLLYCGTDATSTCPTTTTPSATATCPTSGAATAIAATTDTSGRFSISGATAPYCLKPGYWTVLASATGYEDLATGPLLIQSGANDLTGNPLLRLVPLATVTGQLLAQNLGVPNATVTLTLCGTGTTAPTTCAAPTVAPSTVCDAAHPDLPVTTLGDSAGRFGVAGSPVPYCLTPGWWQITATAPGYQQLVTAPIQLVAGVTNLAGNAELGAMQPLASVSGQVMSGAAAVPNAIVTLAYCGSDTTTTGCPTTQPSKVSSDCPIDGSVTAVTATADASGRFVIAGSTVPYCLTPGYWKPFLSAIGQNDPGTAPILLAAGANSLTGTNALTMSALASVTGQINANGVGVGSARVQLVYCGSTSSATCGPSTGSNGTACQTLSPTDPVVATTDSGGRFTIIGASQPYCLSPGYWTVYVSAPGYTVSGTKVQLEPGSNDLTGANAITIASLGTATGLLVAGGTGVTTAGVPSARVRFVYCGSTTGSCPSPATAPTSYATSCATDGTGTALQTTTDAGGHFAFAGVSAPYCLQAGYWELFASAPGYQDLVSPDVLISPGSNDLTSPGFTISALGAVTGSVRGVTSTTTGSPDASLPAVSGAIVTAWACSIPTDETSCATTPQVSTFQAQSDFNGAFTIVGTKTRYALSPGYWNLSATASGYGTASVDTLVGSGENTLSAAIRLPALGALSGQISGLLAIPSGGDQSAFTQVLSGASVAAYACKFLKNAGPPATSSNTSCATTPTATRTTDTAGHYDFGNALSSGPFEIIAAAFGYQSTTEYVVVSSGGNQLDLTLPVNLATQPIQVKISGTTSYTSSAVLSLSRVDDPNATIAPPSLSGTTYSFAGLVPTTYQLSITGDSSKTGQSIIATIATITVPKVATDGATAPILTVQVTVIKNGVSGTVDGPDATGTVGPLSGVTVLLGHLSGTTFVQDQDASGTKLATTTGSTGGYTFAGVPNGTYVAQINNAPTAGTDGYGYTSTITSSVTVNYGATADLGTSTLAFVLNPVTVTVTKDAGDDVSGANAITLTNQTTPTWTYTGQLTAGGAAADTTATFSFTAVPAGCWAFSAALPTGHPGAFALTSAGGSCPADSFVVSGAQSGSQDPKPSYQITEHVLTVTVAATPSGADPSPSPFTPTVTITDSKGHKDVDAQSVTPGTPTPFVLAADTYTVSAGSNLSTTAWVSPTPVAADLGTGPASASLAFTETGSITTKPYTGADSTHQLTVTATCTQGQNQPTACATTGVTATDSGSGVTLSGLASGTWSLHITGTVAPSTAVDQTIASVTVPAGGTVTVTWP